MLVSKRAWCKGFFSLAGLNTPGVSKYLEMTGGGVSLGLRITNEEALEGGGLRKRWRSGTINST